jgi:hypothetical protein
MKILIIFLSIRRSLSTAVYNRGVFHRAAGGLQAGHYSLTSTLLKSTDAKRPVDASWLPGESC